MKHAVITKFCFLFLCPLQPVSAQVFDTIYNQVGFYVTQTNVHPELIQQRDSLIYLKVGNSSSLDPENFIAKYNLNNHKLDYEITGPPASTFDFSDNNIFLGFTPQEDFAIISNLQFNGNQVSLIKDTLVGFGINGMWHIDSVGHLASTYTDTLHELRRLDPNLSSFQILRTTNQNESIGHGFKRNHGYSLVKWKYGSGNIPVLTFVRYNIQHQALDSVRTDLSQLGFVDNSSFFGLSFKSHQNDILVNYRTANTFRIIKFAKTGVVQSILLAFNPNPSCIPGQYTPNINYTIDSQGNIIICQQQRFQSLDASKDYSALIRKFSPTGASLWQVCVNPEDPYNGSHYNAPIILDNNQLLFIGSSMFGPDHDRSNLSAFILDSNGTYSYPVSLVEGIKPDDLSAYPNPSSNFVTIDIKGQVRFYNTSGQSFILPNQNVSYDISGLKSGLYFAVGSDGENTRFVKY